MVFEFKNYFCCSYSTFALSSGTKSNYYFPGESLKSFSGEILLVSEINFKYLIFCEFH